MEKDSQIKEMKAIEEMASSERPSRINVPKSDSSSSFSSFRENVMEKIPVLSLPKK